MADGALRGVAGRPMVLKRFVNGAEGEPFFQKRAPESRPDWIDTVELQLPVRPDRRGGRAARTRPRLAWVANLGCIDLNPHPVRADDLDHPDELRVDLDPVPGVEWPQIRPGGAGRPGGARRLRADRLAEDVRLARLPRLRQDRAAAGTFADVRRAAVALAREVERRAPELATAKWWKEERHGVFVDYNQNAKDRTVASAYSVRPTPDARVSTPLAWDEVPDCTPAAFTIDTVPDRFARLGDPWAGIDDAAGSLSRCSSLAAQRRGGRAARRPVAAALRPSRRASRRGCSRPSARAAGARRRPRRARPGQRRDQPAAAGPPCR